MPTFDTPDPVAATIDVAVTDIRFTASDRLDTVVTVVPSDPSHDADVRAASQTRVELTDGRLLVRTPKQRGLGLFGKAGSVDVTIEAPTASHVDIEVAMGAIRCAGLLGTCRVKMGAGNVSVERAETLVVTTGAGAITVAAVTGNAEATTGAGKLHVGDVGGNAVIKNSNGDCRVGSVVGNLRVVTANGGIYVARAGGDVTASTANGEVSIATVVRGSVAISTGMGEIDLGVDPRTAARLDVRTSFGTVVNRMEATDGPGEADATVDIRARTRYGDIVVRRSAPAVDLNREGGK